MLAIQRRMYFALKLILMRNIYTLCSILLLAVVLLSNTGCKKETVVKTTGNVVIGFRNMPSDFSLYTEYAFGTTNIPLLSSGQINGLTVIKESNKLTIEGLNAGNYVLMTFPNNGKYAIQVGAGETRNYFF